MTKTKWTAAQFSDYVETYPNLDAMAQEDGNTWHQYTTQSSIVLATSFRLATSSAIIRLNDRTPSGNCTRQSTQRLQAIILFQATGRLPASGYFIVGD